MQPYRQWYKIEPKEYERCDKRNSHISSKLHLIYISSDNARHRVPKTFTTLHFFCLYFTPLVDISLFSHLNFTQLHYSLIWLNPISISYRSISPHITTFHLISLHCTFRRFSPHFYSFHFTPFIIAFLTMFLKISGLQGEAPNASAGGWFQFLMVLFTKEHFQISVLGFLPPIFRTWSNLLKY